MAFENLVIYISIPIWRIDKVRRIYQCVRLLAVSSILYNFCFCIPSLHGCAHLSDCCGGGGSGNVLDRGNLSVTITIHFSIIYRFVYIKPNERLSEIHQMSIRIYRRVVIEVCTKQMLS